MVPSNTNKNNSILLELFASVFTVSSNFPDNPRISLPVDLWLIILNVCFFVATINVKNALNVKNPWRVND